jgi:hypothetical protein
MEGTITAEQLARTLEGTDDQIDFDYSKAENNTPAEGDTKTDTNTDSKPEQTAPTDTPTFNLDSELEKISGGAIKTKDQLSSLLETSRRSIELETRLRTYEEENTNLKARAETNPFANDFTKKLNDLYASNANESQIQAFMAINKVNIDELSPLQASSLALQVKFGLTPEDAEIYLRDKYGVDPEQPDQPLSKQAEIALKIDSATDRDFLRTHKAQVSQIPANQQEQQERLMQEQYNQTVQKLAPIASSVVTDVLANSFKGFSINGKDGEGAIRIDLPIGEETKGSLNKVVADMVASNWDSFPTDPEAQKEKIQTFANNVVLLQNYKNMFIDIASKTEMRVRAEYNNAEPINRGNNATPQGRTKAQERVDGITRTLTEAGII